MGAGIRLEPRSAPLVLNSFLALLLLYYAAIRLPLFGIILTALVPLPIILVHRRVGWRGSLLVVGGALGFILGLKLIWGFSAEILLFVQMAVAGVLVGHLEQRGHAVEATIGIAVLGMALINAAAIGFQMFSQGLSARDYVDRTVQELLGYLGTLMNKEGVSLGELMPEGIDQGDFSRFIIRVSPALMLINSIVVVWLNVLLSRGVLVHTAELEETPPLSVWEAPGFLIFALIGAGFMMMVPVDWIGTLGLNLLLVSALVYFFQGLAIIAHTFQRFQVPRFLRFMLYPWLVLLKPAMLVVALLGMTDLWLDYRQLHPPPAKDDEEA